MPKKQNWIILSLGGSIVVPDKIDPHTNRTLRLKASNLRSEYPISVGVDIRFLRNFRKFILKWVIKGKRFIIFVGGGRTARCYQKEARRVWVFDQKTLDWIGIYATYLNASLVLGLFKNKAYPQIVKNPTKKINTNKKIIIAGGWKPGWSTDYDAVRIAQVYKTRTIINLSDIDYVYDKDPDKFKNAKPFEHLSFSKFFKIGGKKWKAGLNLPFGPIASKLAQKHNFKVIILRGTNLKNLDNLFKGKSFKGTMIQN